MTRIAFLVVFACACMIPSFGQGVQEGQSPIIVKKLVLTNQTQPLGSAAAPVPLFTPAHDGFYRATVFIGQSNGTPYCGDSGTACVFLNLNVPQFPGFWEGGPNSAFPFPAKAGQAICFDTVFSDPPPTSPYNLVIVIEEL